MYEIGVVGILLPGKEHGKKAPNLQTLSSKIDIALRLRPFVTSLSAFLHIVQAIIES
jgi:hypothetical protein